MLNHLENFPLLLRNAWDLAGKYDLKASLSACNKVLICGMGASGISGDIIKDIVKEDEVFFEVLHDYNIPEWVDKNTLVIAVSYSGNTEETLSAFTQSYNAKAKLIAITSGGKLEALAEKYQTEIFSFRYDCQPRAAFPYLFILTLSVLVKLDLFTFSDNDFEEFFSHFKSYHSTLSIKNEFEKNTAKRIAAKLSNKTPVIYSGGNLSSIARRYKTQINENAKTFAFFEILPELNHNAIVGLKHPRGGHFVILLKSKYFPEKMLKRYEITKNILHKNNIDYTSIIFGPKVNVLYEIFCATILGDYISFYLAMLYKENPSSIENIDYLKKQLSSEND